MTNKLKVERNRAGISQIDLAIKAGISPTRVCGFEKGVRPNQANARKLALALGCDDPKEIWPEFDGLRGY